MTTVNRAFGATDGAVEKRIIFLRHGRTAYNAARRLQGQVDIPLDDVGQWQAAHGGKTLARSLQQEGRTPDLIVSSQLVRAAQTAAALSAALEVPATIDERLQERGFGIWEGLTGEEISSKWPQQWKNWRAGIESVEIETEAKSAVAVRVAAAVNEYVAALPKGGTLVVVSHGAAITVAISHLLGMDPEQWRGISGLNNVHWSLLEESRAGNSPDWRLIAHNIGPDVALEQWNAGPEAEATEG